MTVKISDEERKKHLDSLKADRAHARALLKPVKSLTMSSQANPKYMDSLQHPAKLTGATSLKSLDHQALSMMHLDKQKSTKHVDGIRTELDLDMLPNAHVMSAYETWKKSPEYKKLGDPKLQDFYQSSAYKKVPSKEQGSQKDLNGKLAYLEGMDSELKELATKNMKSDITLGLGDVANSPLGKHVLPNGHVDMNNPDVKAYLANLGDQAKFVAKQAAASGAARLELGNEPNDTKNHISNADQYGLVEGTLYNRIKHDADTNGKLDGMRVDMAAMMQMKSAGQTEKYLKDMAASQQYYAQQGAFGAPHAQHGISTDETNMHLYATRGLDHAGQEHFDMRDAEQHITMYKSLMAAGLLPTKVDVSEIGTIQSSGRLWQGDDKTGHMVGPSSKPADAGTWADPKNFADTNVVQADDEYSMLNQLATMSHDGAGPSFQLDSINVYGWGDSASGYGHTADSAKTAVGHNPYFDFTGMGRDD